MSEGGQSFLPRTNKPYNSNPYTPSPLLPKDTMSETAWVQTRMCKDTVSTDEEDDEVDANQDPRHDGTPICHDAVIHDSVPVLTC